MDAYVEKETSGTDDDDRHPFPADPPPAPPGPPAAPPRAPSPVDAAPAAGTGITALSLPYQVVVAVALAVTGVFACVHLAMVFLHVAPSNTLTKRHGQAVDDWIYPEFEQNWKLFAPNPLQQNVSVEVRAEVATAGGGHRTTGWIDLTAGDVGAVLHHPMPSHVQQNLLRRAVDFYFTSHSDDLRPNGSRGHLSEEYMRRIVMLRLGALPSLDGADVRRVQLRTVTRPVAAPAWNPENPENPESPESTESAVRPEPSPSYRPFPWWRITDTDRPAGSGRNRAETTR
ncbi:DUF5819 family protein [Streptomyces sp. NPDC001744]|uniref:DUF5819 family protein n=1 Tax=Streptomyces sp. NPDC001744 TaxID=3364606 RepID=UPI0036BC66C0